MEEIAHILAAGFWPRLMGYISAAKVANSQRVLELISMRPTGIRTSLAIASQLLWMGQRARQAAHSWRAAEPAWEGLLIKIPGIATPNIEGGRAGDFEYGLVMRGNPEGAPRNLTDKAVMFSSNRLMSYEETVERLLQFAAQSDTPGLGVYARDAVNNWEAGRKGFLLPMYVYERAMEATKGS